MSLNPEELIRPSFLAHVGTHLWNMHHWQRSVLAISVLLFGAGTVGNIKNYLDNQSSTSTSAVAPDSPDAVSSTTPQPQPTVVQQASPWASRIGASLLGGFILGFAMRAFVKITSALLALGLSVFMLLSYFHIRNVDLTAAETKYKNSIEWLDDQASRLQSVAQSHLPSSGSAVVAHSPVFDVNALSSK